MKQHRLSWFIKRIGKRIYRLPSKTCFCWNCKRNYVDVADYTESPFKRRTAHAEYLHDVQGSQQIEYRDRPFEESR